METRTSESKHRRRDRPPGDDEEERSEDDSGMRAHSLIELARFCVTSELGSHAQGV